MNFTIDSLTTVVECDNQITIATKEKSHHEARITIWNIQRAQFEDSAEELEMDVNALNAALTEKNDFIAGAPEGPLKVKAIGEKMTLEARIYKLTNRVSTRPESALVDKEYDILKSMKAVEAATEYIAALESRKTQLAA